ncbi:tetratricopeptide repeat protein [Pedobacter changchengzhani]|uniref:Tetratricopeptide repeat protein n=1 Tax=Pedobacter changchengzhani TaxID=2529274 RepID=A0A4R5MJ42_9SPHI|nr:tetratricopeptide repeat protein [Pedobacter changchengzhani]TDG35657.1 tetratricopeptide repeat protein [Pedobacter changchengzhani]
MQKCFVVLLFTFISANAFAQKSQVLIARNAIGKLQSAIENKQDVKKQIATITEGLKATDAAEKDNRTKNWAEVWAIKAYLTSYYAIIETDNVSSDRYFDLSNEALKQAKTLDKYENNAVLIQSAYQNILIKKQDRGNAAFFNNDFANAIEDLKEVSDFYPKDTTLSLNIGICALNISNYDLALKYLKRAKDNGIQNPAVFQKLSQLYFSKFDNDNAIKVLEEGLVLNPYRKALANDLINLLLDTENYTQAESLIEKDLKIEKGSKLLNFLYGYLNQQRGNSETAVLAYNKSLDMDQNYFDSLYQLSLAYINEADKVLEKALPNNEQQYSALINRAQLALKRANELNPNDRNTIDLLVNIYTKKKDLEKAQELKSRSRDF